MNYHEGDLPSSNRYHLDLTLEYGARFFWVDVDRVRSVSSFINRCADSQDSLFTSQVCRDGNRILRFRRTDTGVDPDAANVGAQIDSILSAPPGGYSVIYTHLGVARDPLGKPIQNPAPYQSDEGYAGLDRLVAAQRDGDTLVTTTSRLLRHASLMAAVATASSSSSSAGLPPSMRSSS